MSTTIVFQTTYRGGWFFLGNKSCRKVTLNLVYSGPKGLFIQVSKQVLHIYFVVSKIHDSIGLLPKYTCLRSWVLSKALFNNSNEQINCEQSQLSMSSCMGSRMENCQKRSSSKSLNILAWTHWFIFNFSGTTVYLATTKSQNDTNKSLSESVS